MIFIKLDELNHIQLIHHMPFDEKYGLGKTKTELESEGIFVDSIPTPDTSNPKMIPELKYNGSALYYEYIERPLTPEDKIQQLESELAISKEDNVSNMLAITELYELILGGTA
ncbi:hypothetical protein [Fictibacillus phosphorivorans]|uniref:hypothetical protein n=1 Tax=Fictibacillus phosphorivorans TaxID=1221500 RepID=UPI00119DD280|nr:hypothetical protein [Fictibacillus phosphorivorans]